MILLERSRRKTRVVFLSALCRASLEEDPDNTEDDVHAELGVIRVQMGYVLQQLGQQDEALKLYNVVIKQKFATQARSCEFF